MSKKNKFFSRKFLVCLGEALLGMGAVVTGLCIENDVVTIIGAALTALGTGIYTFCEAWVDKTAVGLNETEVEMEMGLSEEYINNSIL